MLETLCRYLLIACAALLVAAPAASAQTDARGLDPRSPNPLLGLTWWIDHEWHPAWRSYRHLRDNGKPGSAALVRKLAEQPQFKWFGRTTAYANPESRVRGYLNRAQEQMPGSVPQIVSMRHEGRKCSPDYTGGGAKADAVYRTWMRGFARGIGNHRVVIAFEPDSLGTVDCLKPSRRPARYRALRYGIEVLSKLPNTTVYVDAGASDWESASETARKLRRVGIHNARGFMLNATHMDWTKNNIQHGLAVSRKIGGKPFMINTSHNGNGPLHYRKWIDRSRNLWKRINVWCNPPNSAVGSAPTTNTAHPKVDAYLWVERPGYSNGFCNGGPKTGGWWLERALLLAKRAKW